MEMEVIERFQSQGVLRKKSHHFKNEKVATYYLNAKVLIQNDEYALALNLLRSCSSLDPFNQYILDALFSALVKCEKLSEAQTVAETNFKFNYSLARCLELADIYFLNGKDEESLKLYFDCLSNVIENEEVLFKIYKNIANIYVKFREFDSAEEFFNKSYKIKDDSDVLLVNMGVLEFQKCDLDKSLFCFRKAIEINNNNDKAWVGLAMTHIELGDKELSWGNLTKALDINSQNKTALKLLCQFFSESEKNAQCRGYLLKYLEQQNFDEEISMLLIQNLVHDGDFFNAYLESFKNYLWNPDNKENEKIYLELKKYTEGECK